MGGQREGWNDIRIESIVRVHEPESTFRHDIEYILSVRAMVEMPESSSEGDISQQVNERDKKREEKKTGANTGWQIDNL